MWKLMIFALFCPVYSAPLSKDRYKYKAACKKPEKQGAALFSGSIPICTGSLLFSDMHRAAGDVHLDHTGAVAIKQRAAAFAGRA